MSELRPRVARGARLRTDPVTGRPVLLYPEGVLLLNPTAAVILTLCDGRRSLAELAAELAVRYSVSQEELACDLGMFLGRLRDRGLLRWEPGEDDPL
jgi:pyrroloquinoline quinone biosynthesis protein D